MEIEFHELANLFPMLGEKELHELAIDIKTRGQEDPIITFDGKILDGRNRYRACLMAGIKPKFKEYAGTSPITFVLSKNLHRRHLTESQRAMVAAKLATMKQGERTDLEPSANLQKVSRDSAAEACKVSTRSVASAREVIDHGTEELREAVEQGEVSVSAAAEVARMPEADQRRIVAEGAQEVRRVASEIRVKRSSEMSRVYERATKALSAWREKFLMLGDGDLKMIISEIFDQETAP